jgi:PAS domain S-box-containing protein
VYRIHGVDDGYDPNDIKASASFYIGEDNRRVLEAFEACCRGMPYDLELRMHRADGEKIFVRVIGRPVFEGDVVVQVVGNIMDITERKLSEEAILERERTIAQASSLAKVGHWIWRDATGEFVFSDGLCQLLGIEKGATLPHDYFFLTVHPDDRVMVINALDAALKGRRKFDLEHRMVRSDGSTIMVRDLVEVTSTSGNRPVYMLGMVQDISEMKAAGEALRESKNLYHTLVDTVAEGIIMLAADGEALACNSEAARILGLDPENALAELSRQPSWDILSEEGEQVQFSERPCLLTLGLGVPTSHHIMGIRRGGEVRWISLNTRPLFRDGEDLPYAAVASFSDVTERKRIQDVLRENEGHYRELVEMAPFPVMISSIEDDRILLVNAQMERKFLMSKEAAAQTNAQYLYADPSDRVDLVAALMKHGHVVGFEARMKDGEGCEFWVSTSASRARFEGREVSFVSFIDITERRQAQEEAQMANRKLSLVNDITRHDALNQLTAIQGNVALLQRKGLTQEQEALVQRILDSTRNMTGQLGFARLYQDIGKQKPGWQSLLSSMRRAQAASTHAELQVSMPETDVLIWADPMFERVALNLIDNAARHGRARNLLVRTHENEGELVLELSDDGQGINADKRADLFERKHGGSHGYGLFLTREILSITGIVIEENGGPGQGARFIIRVPPGKWCRGGVPA